MKTIRITLTKDGAQATITHRYRVHSEPYDTTWAGNRDAFKADGRVPHFSDGILTLERVVAHQAALCGASYTIEDLGGEYVLSHDTLHSPVPNEESDRSV